MRVKASVMLAMRKLRRLSQLSHLERNLLARATLLVVIVRLGLWTLPFRLLWKIARQRACNHRPAPLGVRFSPDQVTWAVSLAGRWVPGASCLTRSVATYILLRQLGMSCDLRLGVAKTPAGKFEAHAWVERNGQPVFPHEDLSRFVVLPSLTGKEL